MRTLANPLSEVATVIGCGECGAEVAVSRDAMDHVEFANRILAGRGEELIGRNEIARCRDCYERIRDDANEQAERRSHVDALRWKAYREKWQEMPTRRDELEERFLNAVADPGFYRDVVARWVKAMLEKEAKDGGRRGRKVSAVFGATR